VAVRYCTGELENERGFRTWLPCHVLSWEASVIRDHSREQREKWRYMRQGCLKTWTGGPVAGQLPTASIHSGVSDITSGTVRGQPAPETDARSACRGAVMSLDEPTGGPSASGFVCSVSQQGPTAGAPIALKEISQGDDAYALSWVCRRLFTIYDEMTAM